MEEQILIHHGIKGQRWGVRRFQNEDGTLTIAGRQRLATYKQNTLNRLNRRAELQKAYAKSDLEDLNDLKKNKENSIRARTMWEMTSNDQRLALAQRGGYQITPMEAFLSPVLDTVARRDSVAMKQLVKEDMAYLKESHKSHIKRAEQYTERYKALSMKDVDEMASAYGYKEAKKQLKRA